jgi:hypothetical protein
MTHRVNAVVVRVGVTQRTGIRSGLRNMIRRHGGRAFERRCREVTLRAFAARDMRRRRSRDHGGRADEGLASFMAGGAGDARHHCVIHRRARKRRKVRR